MFYHSRVQSNRRYTTLLCQAATRWITRINESDGRLKIQHGARLGKIKTLYFQHYSSFPSESWRNWRNRRAKMARLTHLLWLITLLASRHLDRSSSACHFKCGLGFFQIVELVFESVFCGVSPSCFISRWFGDSIAGGGVCCGARQKLDPPPPPAAAAEPEPSRTFSLQQDGKFTDLF